MKGGWGNSITSFDSFVENYLQFQMTSSFPHLKSSYRFERTNDAETSIYGLICKNKGNIKDREIKRKNKYKNEVNKLNRQKENCKILPVKKIKVDQYEYYENLEERDVKY